MTNDTFEFAPENDVFETVPAGEPWHILLVDDEQQVHETTRFALEGCLVLDRPLVFTSAYSAAEAKVILRKHKRFACVLLDVVMETEHAGLDLINFIRFDLNESSTRIVIRTGQPGYAPELQVIHDYDINDYKQKTELTTTQLIVTLSAACRSFQQLEMINRHREGLELIIQGAAQIFSEHAIETFSEGVLVQLCSLLEVEHHAMLCLRQDNAHRVQVIAGFGPYASMVGHYIDNIANKELINQIEEVLQTRQNSVTENIAILYLKSPSDDEMVICLHTSRRLTEGDIRLIRLFSVYVSVGLDNVTLFERIENLAFNDYLTSGLNRNGFIKNLEEQICHQDPCMVLLADIDNFQAINDGLGHRIGDLTLIRMREHLQRVLGAKCPIGRISSDNFAIILPIDLYDSLPALMNSVSESLGQGFSIKDYEVPVSLTFGIAVYPNHGLNAFSLLQNAGIALKKAKAEKRGSYVVFGEGFEQELQQRLKTTIELRHCIELNELRIEYQPQFCLKTKKMSGVEALVRWHHLGQLISPVVFIPIAEKSGLIITIGAWILEQACRQQVSWFQETGRSLRVAVNVSVRQLVDPGFLNTLDAILSRTGIDPVQLELEITESMMMNDQSQMILILRAIQDRGITIAIDDFGTGYSSLKYLQELPVNRLKIDRTFVSSMSVSVKDQQLVKLMIEMGHLVDLTLIAEGVEEESEGELLSSLGCDEAQGYFYSRPQPANIITQMLMDL